MFLWRKKKNTSIVSQSALNNPTIYQDPLFPTALVCIVGVVVSAEQLHMLLYTDMINNVQTETFYNYAHKNDLCDIMCLLIAQMYSGHSLLFRFGTLQLCPLPQNINQVEESLSGCSGKDVHEVRTEHNLKNSSTTEGGAEVLMNATLRWSMGTLWSGKILFCYWLFFL